ncbi:hypothetical protein HYX13_02940 [Candidatus Woesearchaeota archaeon]|nr:hypothetical protein [Candidatus Woesearchaeota archaeon]
MSLEVRIFETEQEAYDFLDFYLEKNAEAMQQLQRQPLDSSLLVELYCPITLTLDNGTYSFYGGVGDSTEMTGTEYPTPSTLADGVHQALELYADILPKMFLRPLLFTVKNIPPLPLEEAMLLAQEVLDSLPNEERETYLIDIGGKENLERELEKSLSCRGLNESEVLEFNQEYRKAPKGLD